MVAYCYYLEYADVSVTAGSCWIQTLWLNKLKYEKYKLLSSIIWFLPNSNKNFQPITSSPPSSGLRQYHRLGAPGAAGPDWFFNKEQTAAPGTLGNCHICHPQKRAEALSVSSFCDLIGQSYQTVNSSSGAASGGDPYPAPNENEESLQRDRETLGASHTCIKSHTSS